MNILISNDDGYQSPGIRVLADTLSSLGSVTIIAPDRNRSGASNSLTLSHPVAVRQEEDRVFSVQGTPTDCIQIAFGGLLDGTPDIVVSGINDGPNLGDDTLYSGTVAAAMEGRFLRLTPIAVSMASFNPQHYTTAAQVVKDLIVEIDSHDLSTHAALNINVPDLAIQEIKGIRSTVLGTRHAAAPAEPHQSPRGETLYWLGAAGQVNESGEGTDFNAVNNGFVSVTPLHTDLTDHSSVAALQDWLQTRTTGKQN